MKSEEFIKLFKSLGFEVYSSNPYRLSIKLDTLDFTFGSYDVYKNLNIDIFAGGDFNISNDNWDLVPTGGTILYKSNLNKFESEKHIIFKIIVGEFKEVPPKIKEYSRNLKINEILN
jgi:hypothetical protein